MQRRNTIQREIVYNALCTMKNHPTSDEVYSFVSKNYPSIGRATVYRNLNLLAEEGKIRKVEMPDGADRYDHVAHKHYHFRCLQCGSVYDVDMEPLEDIASKIKDAHGFTFLSHDIIFKGVCPRCQIKNKGDM